MKDFCVGVYEKSMPTDLTIEDKLVIAKKCGFDYLEISIDETDAKIHRLFSNNETNRIKASIDKVGLPIYTMCLSGHRKYPLGEPGDETLRIMYAAIDFAVKLGIRIIQLAGYDTYYGMSNNETKKRFCENLKKSVLYASKKGVILGFETMETDFMNTVEKAMVYVNEINTPYLQVYPDIGNIRNATEKYIDDLYTGKGHIVAVHLKETIAGKYRDMQYGEGRVDFVGNIAALRNMGVNMFTCEFWYDGKTEPSEYLLKNKSYIDKCFKKANTGE